MNSNTVDSILDAVKQCCIKIIQLNFSTHTYQVEWPESDSNSIQPLSTVLDIDLMRQRIHPDDYPDVTYHSDPGVVLRELELAPYVGIKYRFLQNNNTYRWYRMEAFKSTDYSSSNKSLILLIKDIDHEYSKDFAKHRKYEELSTKDQLTSLKNRYAFDCDCKLFSGRKIGVLYLDLNRLKNINDAEGHNAGDRYIVNFSNLLTYVFGTQSCYRTGGDEFIVLLPDIDCQVFNSKVADFQSFNLLNNIPIASCGALWSDSYNSLFSLLESAEKLMYISKSEYHTKFPNIRA